VRVLSRLDEETPYDLVIVTLLAHQAEPLLPLLARSAAAEILLMFNSFLPERLQSAIGSERCGLGMPFIQSVLTPEGRLKASIGAGGQKSLMDRPRWVEAFNGSGLPAALEPRMALWLTCHAPLCVAFESISAAGERRGGGAPWSRALVLARGVHASFALIKSTGRDLHPALKRRIDASPDGVIAAALWLLSRIRSFRTLLATGEQEGRALVEAMISSAPAQTPSERLSDIHAMSPPP
jgi:2-dehydropantoate 2-reductase